MFSKMNEFDQMCIRDSLYTNVPIKETIQTLEQLLRQNNTPETPVSYTHLIPLPGFQTTLWHNSSIEWVISTLDI